MRISYRWLKHYVDFSLPPEELAQRLTMVGLEVESIEHLGEKYRGFLVGEVLETRKHPKADRLTVCTVNAGVENLQIVCGAPNVAPGQKVAVGMIGARVPKNQHDPLGSPFVLSHVKLRGEDSYGMICSAYELDLGEDKDGILVLDDSAKVGIPFAEYLGLDDSILEVGITPNRPDAMSHIGVGREVAMFVESKVCYPPIKLKETKTSVKSAASIVIEDVEDCPRYTARVILNIKVGPSPKWMQDRLQAVGLRPVNNIVDVTNFVLMECGHPLHAFDYDKLTGKNVVVKLAREGERFTTLDHKERILRSDTLVICDAVRPVALAGVMGGTESEISDSTVNILLESAYFKPQSIRRTSKHFGLSSEASQRFERGADPEITRWAVDRASQLIQECGGGEILRGVIDVYPKKIKPVRLNLRIAKTNEILGTKLDGKTISSYLAKLDFNTKLISGRAAMSGKVTVTVPTFRPDIEREIDLVEEIARVFGYDNIETKASSKIVFSNEPPREEFEDVLRRHLVGAGMMEVVANSMQEKGLASLTASNYVEIANPISKDMGAMRTSMIPGMLQILRHNIFHGIKDLRLFEIGEVYFRASSSNNGSLGPVFNEQERVIMAFSGNSEPRSWDREPRQYDIYDIKGEVETLLRKIFLDKIKFIPYSTTKALTQEGLLVEIHGEAAGFLGVIHSDSLRMFEIEQPVFVAELATEVLSRHQQREKKFKSLPLYPAVVRDLSIVLEEGVPADVIENEIRSAGAPLLRSVELFDIYSGEQIGEGKKSCAFALEFMSEDHTLTQVEVDQIMQQIIGRLSHNHQASIRK